MTVVTAHQFACWLAGALCAFAVMGCAADRTLSAEPAPGQVAAAAQPSKRGFVPVNGLSMYYEIWESLPGTGGESNSGGGGEYGGEMPLVLLHGGGSTIQTSFGNVLGTLSRRRTVIAFEQQGHGHTADIADRPFTFEQSADDAAVLMERLKIRKADFFGYSNGGSIALQIAIRHPDLVRRLVVASAMYKRDGLPPEFWESMKQASLDQMPTELKEAYQATSPHPEQLQSFHDKCVRRMLEFQDLRPEVIRSIEAPTLIMVGDSDIVRPEHALEMFRLLPHAQLAVLPGTDHMTIIHRTDWEVSMVESFLDTTITRSSP